MLKSTVEKALNDQVNAELYSAYLYLSMASFFESINLRGMANWMKIQSSEELGHAMKFFNFINERSGKVTLAKIEAPPKSWKNPIDLFQNVLEHEKKVTSLIHKLVSLSDKEKDFPLLVFLQWFVSEQVEEEASAMQILESLKMIKDNPSALFLLDKELGNRKPSQN